MTVTVDILQQVKDALRVENAALDSEIQALIDSARGDLVLSGILEDMANSDDAMVVNAIIMFCKANFGLDNRDSEKLMASYLSFERDMMANATYTEVSS